MNPTDAEYHVLTSPDGALLLDRVAAVAAPGPADLERWRREASPELVAAAMRLAEARRKGATKFTHAASLWLDPVGVEQATAEAVAQHKAERFDPRAIAVDLCSGIGGDAVALARRCRGVLAVDRDPGMARRVDWNARVHGVEARLLALQGNAARFAIPAGALVHVDPDRRANRDRRARRIEDYVPSFADLVAIARRAAGGAVKVGPASDFDRLATALPGAEVELVSLDRECKEATIWFGALAGGGVARRATALPAGFSWTDRDGPAEAVSIADSVDRLVFEPDPALTRAGLIDGFAAAHALGRLAPGVDLLTGPAELSSPWLIPFEVEDIAPLDRRRLRRLVRDRGIAIAEIKVRGLGPDWQAERLRRELAPPPDPGPRRTLLLVAGPRSGRAILARRLAPGPSPP